MNHILKLSPPLQSCEVDRCHRIGPAKDRQGNPRKRPLLVKFTSYGSRARVLGLRGRLRALARGDPLENPSWPAPLLPPEDATTEPHEGTDADDDPRENATPQINYEDYANKPIYFNEDLTKSHSLLAKEARNLYKQRKINDTWVYDGKILIKDKNGLVKMINNMAELDTFK